jgi:hypothetical protein
MPLKAVISNIGKKLGRVYLILDLPKRLCMYKGSSLFAQSTVTKTKSLTTWRPERILIEPHLMFKTYLPLFSAFSEPTSILFSHLSIIGQFNKALSGVIYTFELL